MKKVYGVLIAVVLVCLLGLGAFLATQNAWGSLQGWSASADTRVDAAETVSSRGGYRDGTYDDLTPEDTVALVLDSLIHGDSDTVEALVYTPQPSAGTYSADSSLFSDEDPDDGLWELFEGLEYEILQATRDGDDAYVLVSITSYDLSGLYDELDDDSDFQQAVGRLVENIVGGFTTGEPEFHLSRIDGRWQIEADSQFVKAITGGAISSLF